MYGHVVQSEAETVHGPHSHMSCMHCAGSTCKTSAFNRLHHSMQGLATDGHAGVAYSNIKANHACLPSKSVCCLCVPPLNAENKLCSWLLVCLCIGLIKQSPLEDLLVLLCSTVPGAVTLHPTSLDALQATIPTNPAHMAATRLRDVDCSILYFRQ